MSAVPEAVPRPAPARYPIRARTDGDFDLAALLAAEPPGGQPHAGRRAMPVAGLAEAAAGARLWRLPAAPSDSGATVMPGPLADLVPARPDPLSGAAPPADVGLLHSFETGSVLRPPVADRCSVLTPALANAWLNLAAHWIGLAGACGDLRFFNAACKLLGAVRVSPPGIDGTVGEQIKTVAGLAETATIDLAARLASQFRDASPDQPGSDWAPARRPGMPAAGRRQRTVLLAAAGSGTAGQLAVMAGAAGARLAGVCWYAPPASDGPASSYADAWYPAGEPPPARPRMPGAGITHARAATWDHVSGILRGHDADLVILAGMPIVPTEVLRLARLGMINAHNGALPAYRGMDAVAWAILGNDPVTCTLHLAEPGPDRGAVLGAVTIPSGPPGTLRARVKATQLRMLTTAAVHVTDTGSLPAATPQPAGQGRQFYRLHPHIKRILDASPYGTAPARQTGRRQP